MEQSIIVSSKGTIFNEKLKIELRSKINQLGDFKFEDDVWYFNKKHKDAQHKRSYVVRFLSIDDEYKEALKYYTLIKNNSVLSIQRKVYKFGIFLVFMKKNYQGKNLKEVDRSIINKFEYELRLNHDCSTNRKAFIYSAVQDIFEVMRGFPVFPDIVPTKEINPFKQVGNKNKRVIPNEVIKKLDFLMKDFNVNVPLEFRTLYWLMRSFPNRITEILSMKRSCLNTFYSEYTITIPSFKQNGGYLQGELKTIPVIYHGHGKFVIDLIKKLQRQTESLLENFELGDRHKKNSDYLFIVRHWSFRDDNNKVSYVYNKQHKTLRIWDSEKINKLIKELVLISGIKDTKGNIYCPTTHQFRHNAITDRLYQVGYTVEQIIKLTKHKNTNMLANYIEQIKEKHKEVHLNISNLKNAQDSAVSFRGRIMNLDEKTIKYLSKDINKYLTWEVNGKKGVGICGDIIGCNPKGTSIHFECYACDWFIPKADYLEDYKKEHQYWLDVIERTANDKRRAAHLENAVRNVSYLERIIEVCQSGIVEYEGSMKEKIKNENVHRWE
ncbi:hypothetical protein ABD81_16390 [Bacillus thuringiensis]|uniref:Tyr recombinase domain-containing protein n=1 Tax=Bacillus wiedmannii TaxID=1890302 RepID=A0A242Z094_9BACI|nr:MULTISPECIES: tyrosine-type recombinase/integrase [Bacillus cereus group]MBG9747795.1 hypothetical protein [Bacillus thuringiensis]MBG9747816.1 hypothetical protein [Bacillus thuringiensis]MBG9749329.1 hypothetical protein [Bacillus thuringiensis]MBG9753071.1 hypothetical protein [Bacillus thuringiensis]MBG9776371.1 hypothetical protein [Bacillus thuringiensis]